MESTTLCSSVLPSFPSLPRQIHSRKMGFGRRGQRSSGMPVCSTRRDSFHWDQGKSNVDEGMIVLRRRIHEMRMAERNSEPPVEWMEWEKQCYAYYDALVCNFVGYLQLGLMNARPSLAIGMLLLIAMSVPMSTVTIALRLMEVADGICSAIHLG